MKFLCFIGFHDWAYFHDRKVCGKCPHVEFYNSFEDVSEAADEIFDAISFDCDVDVDGD